MGPSMRRSKQRDPDMSQRQVILSVPGFDSLPGPEGSLISVPRSDGQDAYRMLRKAS
jgi:hypothetical protein